MTTEKDSRLVDYLYDELTDEEAEAFEQSLESDEALSSEVAGLAETLDTLRTVEAEEPPPHLDSLILAHARQVADEAKEKRGWFRKFLGSPIAGLVAAGSVAMIAALIAVPSMMDVTSEQAPRAVEQIPSPAVVKESEAIEEEEQLKPANDPAAERTDDAPAETPAPKKKARKALTQRQSPKPSRAPAPKQEPEESREKSKVETTLSLDEFSDEADGLRYSRTGPAAGPTTTEKPDALKSAPVVMPKPDAPKLPPAPPPEPRAIPEPAPEAKAAAEAEPPPAPAVGRTMARKSEEARREPEKKLDVSGGDSVAEDKSKDNAERDDEAQREERGRSMLAAASAEFKRNNPVGGREILVRALSVVRGAPVHAEIAFRLAQYDLSRGAYREAVYYARIAASAAKFDKRTAAMDIVVEAERRLADTQSMDDDMKPAAPATQPPADADESAR